MLEAKANDTVSSVLQKKNNQKFFQAISKREKQKRSLQRFLAFSKKFNGSKNRQFLGIDLRSKGQGLQNVSLRTPPLLIVQKNVSYTHYSTPLLSYPASLLYVQQLKASFLQTFALNHVQFLSSPLQPLGS